MSASDTPIISPQLDLERKILQCLPVTPLPSPPQLDLERKILQCLPVLSVDELGIICMSFFKTQTPLQLDELVDAIVYKLLSCVETAKPETVCAVLKLLRLSVPARRWQVGPHGGKLGTGRGNGAASRVM